MTVLLPPLPRAHVARERILAAVPADVPVVCVVAGAGWGKSVILRELAGRAVADGRRVAWVELDAATADARRFWRTIVRAIAAAVSSGDASEMSEMSGVTGANEALVALAGAIDEDVDTDQVLASLLGELAELADVPAPVTPVTPDSPAIIHDRATGRVRLSIVVDDLHVVHDHQLRAAFASLADQLPAGVQLLIGSRQEPAFPLAAWRLRARVAEIREPQLRYTADEARQVVDAVAGRPIDEVALADLLDDSEGWPVGVQFHALAARHDARADDVEAASSGSGATTGLAMGTDKAAGVATTDRLRHRSHRLSQEYLLAEVLATLPDDLRRFVLDTSVLPVLDDEACAAITGRADGSDVAAELERLGIFVIRLGDGGREFRYHHLFRDLLQTELARSDRERWETVHRRAAAHLVDRCAYLDAVDHLLEVADHAAALRVLTEHHQTITRTSTHQALTARAARFPPSFARVDPRTALDLAIVAAATGRFSSAVHLVASLRQLELPTEVADQRTWADLALSSVVGDVDRVVALRCARPAVMPEALQVNSWREVPITLLLADGFDECDDEWAWLADRGVLDTSDPVVAISTQAFLAAWRGRMVEAAPLVEAARRAHDDGGPRLRTSFVRVPCAGALVRMQTGDPVAAAGVATRMLDEVAGQLERHTTFDVPLAVTALRAWRLAGEPWRAFDRSVPLVDSLPGIARPWLMSLVAEELVRCACDLGDVPAAERALAQVRGGLAVSLARAHVLVARCESAAARAALADLEPAALVADSPARALEVAVLRHLTATTSRDLADALAHATEIATTHRLSRSLEAGLRRSVRTGQPAGSSAASGALADHEPLSARELEVLRLLPSDLPNAELASELFVSLNTLKTHMKSVYRKLGATSRADAVRRGRELGVLPPRH